MKLSETAQKTSVFVELGNIYKLIKSNTAISGGANTNSNKTSHKTSRLAV